MRVLVTVGSVRMGMFIVMRVSVGRMPVCVSVFLVRRGIRTADRIRM